MIDAKSEAIKAICTALSSSGLDLAASLARDRYPFVPEPLGTRKYGPRESTRVFIRDGFIDRYSGEKLIYPPVLRALSHALPEEFPYHPNWKADSTHSSYWEAGATIDHLVPVTRGGEDNESNWFTTSMARNSAKMNWTLEELGWELHPPGRIDEWDGMFDWFLRYAEAEPAVLKTGNVGQWVRAAKAAVGGS